MCWLSRPLRRVRRDLLALVATVCFGLAACQKPPVQHAERVAAAVFVLTCSGQIYKIDVAGARLLTSATLYERAKGVAHGRGVDGCIAENAAFDAVRSELIVVAPLDAPGEEQRAQLIRLSSSEMQVSSVISTSENLPAAVLPIGPDHDILLSAGVPGTSGAKIVRLGSSGKVLQTWAGSAFFSDARLGDPETIFSRDSRISLKNGIATAAQITPAQLMANDSGRSLRSLAANGVITASLAASSGPNAVFLLTTPGKTPAAAVIDLRNETVTVIPIPSETPLKGLHLSLDGSQLLVEEWAGASGRTGKLSIYDSTKATARATWSAEPLRAEEARFLCPAASRSWLYIKDSSLLIVRDGSVSMVTLPSTIDAESTCVSTPANTP